MLQTPKLNLHQKVQSTSLHRPLHLGNFKQPTAKFIRGAWCKTIGIRTPLYRDMIDKECLQSLMKLVYGKGELGRVFVEIAESLGVSIPHEFREQLLGAVFGTDY